MFENFVTGVLAFASTNIDDIFILTLLFGSLQYRDLQIYIGQFVGISALVIISLLGALLGNFVDPRYIELLGLFPVYLGLKQLVYLLKQQVEKNELPDVTLNRAVVPAIASLTIANGGDNIGVYVPLFSTREVPERAEIVFIFAMMVFTWCWLARYLSRQPLLAGRLARYGHIIMPLVLVLLGVSIVIESNAMTLLFRE